MSAVQPDPTIETRFAAWLKSLDPRERLAVIRRLGICPQCGDEVPPQGHQCWGDE